MYLLVVLLQLKQIHGLMMIIELHLTYLNLLTVKDFLVVVKMMVPQLVRYHKLYYILVLRFYLLYVLLNF